MPICYCTLQEINVHVKNDVQAVIVGMSVPFNINADDGMPEDSCKALVTLRMKILYSFQDYVISYLHG